ncbi:unnamed protein product [Penicillium camemberti]|uniref:Str. FM013 n=1 Tax=Penicillium camemberti (strain FM 013) TaxID=1429867 RepID=A0A0G4P5L7_PENC3|nr:unnamed protein product [Penicillium camemberti]
MPGHCIQNRILCLAARVSGQERLIACTVLGKRNVAVLPVKSTVFPLFTAARCPTDSPWLYPIDHTIYQSYWADLKIPSEQLFFLALRSRGTDRALRHIHPASLLEIIPRPHGVVFTNLSRPLSIGYRLIELHHERTSTGTIESHNGLKT